MTLSKSDQEQLKRFVEQLKKETELFLGYPVSKDCQFSELLPLLDYPLNNLGDPFASCTYRVNSREFEREVIAFFAELLRAPEDNWWGYVTNGGTEGNLYGLYLARELYPNGIVYFSEATHYSVVKNLHLLNMRHIMIRSTPTGEIDYEDLRETVRLHRDVPALVFANSGTTMTEGKDDLNEIQNIFRDLTITNHYIHVDAALCGAINPFLVPRPSFDFADGADSISISGHKFLGSPIPCGVVVARKDAVNHIANSIAYIGSLDTTITGSRNGFTPVVLWYTIKSLGPEGLKKRVDTCLETAQYALERLQSLGIDAWRLPNALTIVFPEPSQTLQKKWQLATARGMSHIMTMPTVTKEQVDKFVTDFERELGAKT